MGKGIAVLLVILTCVTLLCECHSQESLTVMIDSYTHNSTLTSGDLVPPGTQIILVCQVVGLPYGTPLNYTWTCPNGPCEVEGYYGRKVYNGHILVVNTTSTSDGGTYTCQVTATGGQEAAENFTLSVSGGDVVHSYGRLIPHEFPITDLQQISGPDGIGSITCTVSSETANFIVNSGNRLETGGVSQTRNGSTATLVVNPSDVVNFQNRGLYCTNIDINFLYLFISSANPLSVPSLVVDKVTNSTVEYQVQGNDGTTNVLITGYEVIRFGVPMIGQYVNTGRGRRVTISPAVPGAQYRITAWALGDSRSATPAVVDATIGEAIPTCPRDVSITQVLIDSAELNWLPPTESNGEVHYIVYYTPEGGTEQSIDTGSDLTHYNLTGRERNRVYTNIAVQAVNSAGRSERSTVIDNNNHTPPVPSPPRAVNITSVFQGGVELSWLPPTTPNGEVYYVIYYTPEGGTEQSFDTGSNLHYNWTGLEKNRVYTNIAVQAVHLVGRSERSAIAAVLITETTEAHTAPSNSSLLPAVVSLVVVVLLLITCVALLVLALAVTATKLNKLRAEKAHTDPIHCYIKTGGGEGKTKDKIYDEVGEGTDPIGGQKGHYQELKLETMETKQYETLHGGH